MFDVEGTLVDAAALTLQCWQETFRSFGYKFSLAQLHPHSGQDAREMLQALLPRERARELDSQLTKAQGERYRAEYLPQVVPFPGVRKLFERIKQDGRPIALATSSSNDECKHYRTLADVGDLVDAMACGDDVEHDKPDPALALQRAGDIAPESAVMVGDTPYDAMAASRIGATAIGVRSGGFSEAELSGSGCSAVYLDVADLLARYDQFLKLAA